MSVEQQQICRLCLKVAKKLFSKVDEIVKQMFNILLLKLDLYITRDPHICQVCIDVAKNCLNFKLTCIHTELNILSYMADREEVKCNIKVIYEQRKYVCTVFDEDFKVCRFCMTQFERNNIVSLDIIMNESMFEMLSEYMVEMDFNNTEYPVICTNCIGNLDDYFKFVLNCVGVEEKLKAYYKERGTGNMGHVNLGYVLQYHEKCSQTCKIEQECSECVYPETYIELMKQDDLDIRGQELITKENSYRSASEINPYKYGDAFPHKDYDEENHILIHKDVSEIKTYKCYLCAYESKKKGNVKGHLLVHKDVSEIEIHKCPLCPFESKHKRSLKSHLMGHKNVSEIKMYNCSLCAYATRQRRYLNRHMLVHTDASEIEMYKCSCCTYETKRRRHLNRHMLVHKDVSEIEMYKCSLCPYEAKEKGRLKEHMSVHKDVSQIKMYKCHLCAYESKRMSNVKNHLVVHKEVSDVKVHKCSLCAFESKYKSSVTHHMLIHKNVSEINMHKCALCDFETKRKCSLTKHMLVHKDVKEIEMHKCPLCDYETKHKGYVSTHIMLIHKKVSEVKAHK